MKKINLFLLATLFAAFCQAQTTSDFENFALPIDSFWDGSDLTGSFASGNAQFINNYDTTYNIWSGLAYSTMRDTVTSGYTNPFSSITGGGFYGSPTYAVASGYGDMKIILTGAAAGKMVSGFYITNTTYAYLSMKNSDLFTKKFGGVNGTDPDWFKLTVKGWKNGALKNNEVEFYLADFRSVDSTQDYILKTWEWVNLFPLGNVDSVAFYLSSSDTTSGLGMNNPAYFNLDNFTTFDQANQTPVVSNTAFTIFYDEDTAINVLNYIADTAYGTFTVQLLNTPQVTGATATINGTEILYTPAIGVVAPDTLVYSVCNADNQCDTASAAINVIGFTGIEKTANSTLRLFPNPFTNAINLYHAEDVKEINLYSLDGKLVNTTMCNSRQQQTQINTTELAAGSYIVKVISAGNVTTSKITKQ